MSTINIWIKSYQYVLYAVAIWNQYQILPIWDLFEGEEHAHTDYQVLVIDKMRLKHWTEHIELTILVDNKLCSSTELNTFQLAI